jgi:AcrR family transcriptional regulator
MKTLSLQKANNSKQRLLEAACQLFAERGFHGTSLRMICHRAEVNLATVSYYYHGKEKLYEAVALEASRRLALPAKCQTRLNATAAQKDGLQIIIRSLFDRLSGDSEWIARLVAREMFESFGAIRILVAMGLRTDLVLLQTTIQALLGPQGDPDKVRLRALSTLSLCVFFCAVKNTVSRGILGLPTEALDRDILAMHVTDLAHKICDDGAEFIPKDAVDRSKPIRRDAVMRPSQIIRSI